MRTVFCCILLIRGYAMMMITIIHRRYLQGGTVHFCTKLSRNSGSSGLSKQQRMMDIVVPVGAHLYRQSQACILHETTRGPLKTKHSRGVQDDGLMQKNVGGQGNMRVTSPKPMRDVALGVVANASALGRLKRVILRKTKASAGEQAEWG